MTEESGTMRLPGDVTGAAPLESFAPDIDPWPWVRWVNYQLYVK